MRVVSNCPWCHGTAVNWLGRACSCQTPEGERHLPVLRLGDIVEAIGCMGRYSDWEGDCIEGPYISGVICDGDPTIHPVIIVKQEHSGTTFLACEVEIPGLVQSGELIHRPKNAADPFEPTRF